MLVEFSSQLFISDIVILASGLFSIGPADCANVIINQSYCLKILGVEVLQARDVFTMHFKILIIITGWFLI